jgi:gliding motility-associated-like protein
VHVTCDQSQVFVPNTFTPNNDGVNDYFYPQGKGLSEVRSFKVYNRWGELIFERQNMPLNEPTAGWDGMHKGSPLKPDVFVYIIRAFCESGEPIELKGDISLVR